MNYKTHFIGGLGMGLMANQLILAHQHATLSQHLISSSIIVLGSVFGAKLLDIDHKKSTISHEHKIAGFVISSIFGRRGPIHTPFVCTLFTFGLLFLSNLLLTGMLRMLANDWSTGVLIGLGSHLFLDLFNPLGIMLLYPLSKKRFHLANIITGTWGESVVAVVMIVATTLVLVHQQLPMNLTLSMK